MAVEDSLAVTLRQIRSERGVSQEAVAHRAGISYTTFARIELGQSTPSWATVRRIAVALEVSIVELAGRVEAQERKAR